MSSETKQVEERGQWGRKLEFFLATLGYSCGIGNITRFPYLCMKNGGGAFLIPFFIALFAGGIPLFYVEVALGQFSGLSPLTIWSFCPILRGVGFATVILSGIVSIYYNMLIGWCFIYIWKSFAHDVPWRGCKNDWNTAECYDPFTKESKFSNISNILQLNTTGNSSISCLENCVNVTSNHLNNITTNVTGRNSDFLLPSEDFWKYNSFDHYVAHRVITLFSVYVAIISNVILGVNGHNIEDMGPLRWQLVLALGVAWLTIFLCLMKGVKLTGKVVYFTATFPYVLLTALVVRGVTLDGAGEGLIYYLKPNFTQLADHNTWVEASLQVFYSLGPAWGGLITMASYNQFHNTVNRDALLVPFGDVFTAVYGGFAIFSVVGFMAKATNMPVKRFAQSGIALAFVIYPQAISEMPASPFWSICFFLMMLTLGIDTQFGMVETVISGIFDLFPKTRRYKVAITGAIISLFFIAGLPVCTGGGIYLFTLLDWYVAAMTVTTVAFLEIIIIAYVYGVVRFSADIKLMLGSKPNMLWKICWLIFTPIFTTVLLFFGLWNLQPPTYRNYKYPGWSVGVGWIISSLSFIPIVIVAVYTVFKSRKKTLLAKITDVFLPTEEWLPADSTLHEAYRQKYYSNSDTDDDNLFKCWICHCTGEIFGNSSRNSSSIDISSVDNSKPETSNEKISHAENCL